jgi:hypothetical protein
MRCIPRAFAGTAMVALMACSSTLPASKETSMDKPPQRLVAQELHLVDEHGAPRIVLSAGSAAPSIQLLEANGAPRAVVSLDAVGRPAVKLTNPDAGGPTAALEVDDKGTHVRFDRPGGASSYVFLNNEGVSGIVLIDAKGVRRLSAMVDGSGNPIIQRFDADGKPIP